MLLLMTMITRKTKAKKKSIVVTLLLRSSLPSIEKQENRELQTRTKKRKNAAINE